MKNKVALLMTGCLMAFLTSCLGSSSGYTYEGTKNDQILTFHLSNDSVPGLNQVRFTIDQLGNEIFNLDSMPVGTEIEKVLCDTLTYGPAVSQVRVYQFASKDTIDWKKEDSIDFSEPVQFLVYSYNSNVPRVYDAQICIHTQVPDSMSWKKYNTQLFTETMKQAQTLIHPFAEDSYLMYAEAAQGGKGYQAYTAAMTAPTQWTAVALEGLPTSGLLLDQITTFNQQLYIPATDGSLYASADAAHWSKVEAAPAVRAVLGGMTESVNQPAVLSTIIEQEGKWAFAAMNTVGEWKVGAEVPTDFPVSGFAATSLDVMHRNRLMVIGGKTRDNHLVNTSWSTMDAATWANLTDSKESFFSKREGASVAFYDEKFFLIGGIDESGKGLKDMHTSVDNGVTWQLVDTLIVLPKDYAGRGYASLLVDKDKFMHIFGGKTSKNGNELNEAWRGRINRLGFIRQ